MSTIRRADLILLMEDGQVIERGTHQELMAANGLYHEMVVRQMMSHGEGSEYTLSFSDNRDAKSISANRPL